MGVEPVSLLIVEDNPGDARILRELLLDEASISFTHALAARLEDALEQISTQHFDVVISDLSLPDARDLDSLRVLHERAPMMPIIVLTGTDDVNLGLRAVQAGAQDYLVKGQVDGPLLSRTIRYAIERQRMTIELEHATQQQLEMKDKFLSHVSHELRSPLTTVYQFVTILLDGIAGELQPAQREYLEIALRNVNQLRTMIRDLLDVTRARTGKLIVERRCVSLIELIMESVGSKQATADLKGIRIGVGEMAYVPPVFADADRVRQILTNLIDNALKFTREGGSVEILAAIDQSDPKMVRISVKDTGCGITESGIARIFEHLYQEENDIESSRKGLGIGLFICRELVSSHGGQIWVESEVGTGSTFHFTLPRYRFAELIGPLLDMDSAAIDDLTLLAIGLSNRDGFTGAVLSESVRQLAWTCASTEAESGLDVLLPRLSWQPWGEWIFMAARRADVQERDLCDVVRTRICRSAALQQSDIAVSVWRIELTREPAPRFTTSQRKIEYIVEGLDSAIRSTIHDRGR